MSFVWHSNSLFSYYVDDMIVCMYVDIRNIGIRDTLNAEPKDMGRDWERETERKERTVSADKSAYGN